MQREKTYIASSHGYTHDVFGYYTAPPPIITISHVAGTYAELERLMSVLVSLARATHRAILLPRQGTFIGSDGQTYPRNIWNLFPIGDVEARFDVSILEPNYIEHAYAHLLPDYPQQAAQLSRVEELSLTHQWDSTEDRFMRPYEEVVDELLDAPYIRAKVVKLVLGMGKHRSAMGSWKNWDDLSGFPGEKVKTCKRIEVCGSPNRWPVCQAELDVLTSFLSANQESPFCAALCRDV